MHFTKHAKKRLQQRGFRHEYINFILDYGKNFKKPGGAFEVRLYKKELAEIMPNKKQLLDKCKNKAILISNMGCVITLYNLR